MSDAQRVRDWFESGLLLPPVADTPSSVDLARALAHLNEAPNVDVSPGGARVEQAIGPARQIVFVLIDGLGCNVLERLRPDAFLRRRLVMELRAVFPSTTAAALTSLATAAWPGIHAVPGWFTYLPERGLTATILPFVERFSERPLAEFGVTSAEAFPYPSALPSFGRAVRTYHPRAIAESEYTRYQRGSHPSDGYATPADGAAILLERLREARGPTYHYFYIPSVDATAHRHGGDAPQVLAALSEVDTALERLQAGAPADVRFVISTDHGMLTVPDDAKHIIQRDDPLLDTLDVPPYGEPRVPMFRTRPGKGEEFASQFRERFGERFALLSVEESEQLQLFGPEPIATKARERIGGFIAVAPGPDVLIYQHDGPPAIAKLRGYHAGLTPAEMRIPLIVA
ncbi:MAG: alkaline phosphatase family protein [Dehalococcoidia bacterium]